MTNSRGESSRRFEDRFVSSLLQAKCLFQIRACDSQDVYALQSLAARGVSGADVLLRHWAPPHTPQWRRLACRPGLFNSYQTVWYLPTVSSFNQCCSLCQNRLLYDLDTEYRLGSSSQYGIYPSLYTLCVEPSTIWLI